MQNEEKEHFKIVWLGEPGCGKTEIIRTIVPRTSEPKERGLIDLSMKTFKLGGNAVVSAQFWDVTPNEQYKHLPVCFALLFLSPFHFLESHYPI